VPQRTRVQCPMEGGGGPRGGRGRAGAAMEGRRPPARRGRGPAPARRFVRDPRRARRARPPAAAARRAASEVHACGNLRSLSTSVARLALFSVCGSAALGFAARAGRAPARAET